MVKGVMERHYHDVTRYTSNTFLRMKLGEALARRHLTPKLCETAEQARGMLEKH
jgi:propionate CoA-transferase